MLAAVANEFHTQRADGQMDGIKKKFLIICQVYCSWKLSETGSETILEAGASYQLSRETTLSG